MWTQPDTTLEREELTGRDVNWKQHCNDWMPPRVRLVFIVGVGGGPLHSIQRDMAWITPLRWGSGLDYSNGSGLDREDPYRIRKGVLCYGGGGGSGGTGLLKRWEWRISDFSTCLEGDPDGEDVWPVVSDKSGRWISRFHHIVQPPTPPLEFSNRFTLRASWPPVSPDSKGEHVFAESDSGEGEFIVFPLDFWEVRVERGLGINTGFTEKSKSRPPPPSSPHMP